MVLDPLMFIMRLILENHLYSCDQAMRVERNAIGSNFVK